MNSNEETKKIMEQLKEKLTNISIRKIYIDYKKNVLSFVAGLKSVRMVKDSSITSFITVLIEMVKDSSITVRGEKVSTFTGEKFLEMLKNSNFIALCDALEGDEIKVDIDFDNSNIIISSASEEK